jgi:hypothetical protein
VAMSATTASISATPVKVTGSPALTPQSISGHETCYPDRGDKSDRQSCHTGKHALSDNNLQRIGSSSCLRPSGFWSGRGHPSVRPLPQLLIKDDMSASMSAPRLRQHFTPGPHRWIKPFWRVPAYLLQALGSDRQFGASLHECCVKRHVSLHQGSADTVPIDGRIVVKALRRTPACMPRAVAAPKM